MQREQNPRYPAYKELTTAAHAAAAHAAIARTVAGHDRAAERAGRRVAQVHETRKGIGGVHGTDRWSLVVGRWCSSAVQIAHTFRSRLQRSRTQVLEQQLLLSGQETQVQPAEDVIHDRLGVADVGILCPSLGLEAGVLEFLAQQLRSE